MKTSSQRRLVLIFGGAGFIGSNWAHWLLRIQTRMFTYSITSREGVCITTWIHCERTGEVRTAENHHWRRTRPGCRGERSAGRNEIYHFAAQVAVTTSLSDPRHDYEVNLRGTFNILEAIRQAGNRPFFLFTSTNKVYGELGSTCWSSRRSYEFQDIHGVAERQPLDFHSPYGCSKGAADQYVRDYARMFDIPSVVFRMSCIAGPRQFGNEDQGWVAHFLYSAIRRIPLMIYGDGRQVRDVLCVDDLIRAFESVRANSRSPADRSTTSGGTVPRIRPRCWS